MEELLEKINFYNNQILEQGKKAMQNKEKSFEIIKGKLPIIISAPHCVTQTRNGKIKGKEGETGAIAQYIANKIECYAIYKTYNNQDDANYDIENNPYKEAIIELIKQNNIELLLDLHGASYENEFDIELGTGNGENLYGKDFLIDDLKRSFKKYNIKNITINTKFKAASNHTISKTVSKATKIPCIQLEINGKYRYIKNIEEIKNLLNALIDFIHQIKEKI